jgi:hypothetical protein
MRLLALMMTMLLACATPGAAASEDLRAIEIVGSRFRVTTTGGRVLPEQELVGAVLSYRQGAEIVPVRIDRIFADPKDPAGELLLYGFSIREPASGTWREMCQPDADGLRAGFPLQLGGDAGFVLTCTSGAQGKCVRFGYKPWAAGPDGRPLLAHWQACIRMVRADYCGDDEPHTRDGTIIDMYDKLGIQKDEPTAGMEFEAAWAPHGAVCVRRTRIAGIFPLEKLRQTCPRLLPEDLGEACSEARAMRDPAVLLMNKSVPQ